MLISLKNLKKLNLSGSLRGDTIVEVLIAIAIAAFAIGTSYAIANKSLQRAISASDRNQALSVAESQIADLKTRYKDTETPKFNQYFTAPSAAGPTSTSQFLHFCLLDNGLPTDDATWLPQNNVNISSESDANDLTKYSAPCIYDSGSTSYYIDITGMVTTASTNSKNRTVYKVAVRWEQVGGGPNGNLVLYYRF